MRSIPCEPVSPFANPTLLTLSTGTTIPSTARYIVRANPTVDVQLNGRSGMSNLIQNEGSFNISVYPVGGPSFTLAPGYECRLTWDTSQGKHEVQAPVVSGGGGTVDSSLNAASSNPVTNAAITTAINNLADGTTIRGNKITATAHGLVSGDVGKPLSGTVLLDDTNPYHYPSGVLVSVTDANTIVVAFGGEVVTLPVALLNGGNAYNVAVSGRFVFWDLSAAKYFADPQGAGVQPEILEIFSVGSTTFVARIRSF